jgi:hypothetical protein
MNQPQMASTIGPQTASQPGADLFTAFGGISATGHASELIGYPGWISPCRLFASQNYLSVINEGILNYDDNSTFAAA